MACDRFLSLVKDLDLFGANATFQTGLRGSNKKYTTKFGGFLAIGMVLAYLGFLGYIISTFTSTAGLEQKFTQIFEEKAKPINYTGRMNFAFGYMNDTYSYFSLEKYFELTLSFVTITNNTNKQKVAIPLRQCQPEDFHPDIAINYDIQNLSGLVCPSNKSLLWTKGGESEEVWIYNEYTMRLRDEVVESESLTKEVKQFLDQKKTKFALYFEDVWLNQSNMERPFGYFLNSKFFYADYNIYKKEFYEMSKVSFQTNDDRFADQYTKNDLITLKSVRYDGYTNFDRKYSKTLGNKDYQNLLRYYVISSTTSFVFQRRTLKFVDLLTAAQFFSLMLLFAQGIAIYVNSYYLRRHLMKTLIHVRDNKLLNNFYDKLYEYSTINSLDENDSNSSGQENKGHNNMHKNQMISPLRLRLSTRRVGNIQPELSNTPQKDLEKIQDRGPMNTINNTENNVLVIHKKYDEISKANVDRDFPAANIVKKEEVSKIEKKLKTIIKHKNSNLRKKLNSSLFDKLKTGFIDHFNCFLDSKDRERKREFLEKGNEILNGSLNINNYIIEYYNNEIIHRLLFTEEELEIINMITLQELEYDSSYKSSPEFIAMKKNVKSFLEGNLHSKNVRPQIIKLFTERVKEIFEIGGD